jgi:hypothetical protein
MEVRNASTSVIGHDRGSRAYTYRSIENRLSCCLFCAALPGTYGMSFATHGTPSTLTDRAFQQ